MSATLQPLVAQILYSGLGGHGGVVFAMIEADRPRGWRHTICFLGVEPLLPAYAENCAAEGVDYEYIQATPRRPWLSYAPIFRWLQRVQPDVVLVHSLTALPPFWLHSLKKRIPIVAIEHKANALKTRHEWLFSHIAMRTADAVVVLTPSYREELKDRLGYTSFQEKTRLIANGINTARFHGAKPLSAVPLGTVRIGMAARFSRTKRFDLLFDMLLVLRERAPKVDWQLSLAGSGEQWDEVRAIGERFGFGASLAFEGTLVDSAIIDWYRNLDIYCHASDGETLSVSVLQAMAAGLPIVGSDVEGINNLLVGDPPVGRLVKQQSGSALADAVGELVADHDAARRMAARAQQAANTSYSAKAMLVSYRALVTELLGVA